MQGDLFMKETKVCTKCGEEKLTEDFYLSGEAAPLRGDCIECFKSNEAIKARFVRSFDNLKPEGCECCGKVTNLQCDHDHDLNTFRGFVCKSCNHQMGWQRKKFGDMPTILRLRPETVDKLFIRYYKTAMNRAGLTWSKKGKDYDSI